MRASGTTSFSLFCLIVAVTFVGSVSNTLGSEPNVWTSIGPDGGGINALAIDPQNPRTLYSATSGGIFKSTDGGESWKVLSAPDGLDVSVVAISPLNPATVYAGTSTGVFKTTDGGSTWSSPQMSFPVFTMAIAPGSAGTIFAI